MRNCKSMLQKTKSEWYKDFLQIPTMNSGFIWKITPNKKYEYMMVTNLIGFVSSITFRHIAFFACFSFGSKSKAINSSISQHNDDYSVPCLHCYYYFSHLIYIQSMIIYIDLHWVDKERGRFKLQHKSNCSYKTQTSYTHTKTKKRNIQKVKIIQTGQVLFTQNAGIIIIHKKTNLAFMFFIHRVSPNRCCIQQV